MVHYDLYDSTYVWIAPLKHAFLIYILVAQRIPISLLELNTFGHAVCALAIYILWWEKPFEVEYPTLVQSQIILDAYALVYMCACPSRSSFEYGKKMRSFWNEAYRLSGQEVGVSTFRQIERTSPFLPEHRACELCGVLLQHTHKPSALKLCMHP